MKEIFKKRKIRMLMSTKKKPLEWDFISLLNGRKNKKNKEYYIAIGLCLGVAFGAAFDNIGLGICFGLVFGVAMQKFKKVRN